VHRMPSRSVNLRRTPPPLGGFAPASSTASRSPGPAALPPGIPQGFALGLRPHPLMGPQRGQSTAPNRAGGYRPLCPALRASLFDSPGRGFAPPQQPAIKKKNAISQPAEASPCSPSECKRHVSGFMANIELAGRRAFDVHRMPSREPFCLGWESMAGMTL